MALLNNHWHLICAKVISSAQILCIAFSSSYKTCSILWFSCWIFTYLCFGLSNVYTPCTKASKKFKAKLSARFLQRSCRKGSSLVLETRLIWAGRSKWAFEDGTWQIKLMKYRETLAFATNFTADSHYSFPSILHTLCIQGIHSAFRLGNYRFSFNFSPFSLKRILVKATVKIT